MCKLLARVLPRIPAPAGTRQQVKGKRRYMRYHLRSEVQATRESILPWTPAPVGAFHKVQGSRAKHALYVLSKDRLFDST